MVNQHERYLLQEKLKHDSKQWILRDGSILPNDFKFAIIDFPFETTEFLICPFCLSKSQPSKYLLREKNRYNAKCPICKNGVLFKTLFSMLKWTPKQFADFVFGYRLSGFWGKIQPSFKEWNNRLYALGFGFGIEFWNRNKELKGEEIDNEE
jgi:hypothetical protein